MKRETFAIVMTKRTASYNLMFRCADAMRGDLAVFDFGDTTFIRIDPNEDPQRYAGIHFAGVIVADDPPVRSRMLEFLSAQIRRTTIKKGPPK